MTQAQRIEAPAVAPSIVPDMSRPWVSIDFETANKDKRSACQVAVVRVEHGEIVAERSYLIKPPADVGAWCFTHIHGLSAHSVVAAQGWRGVWSNIEPLFHGVGFVVAHNASFDKGVLEACHAFNQLKPLTIDWHCTVKIGRKVWPEMTTHNLGALAAKLGIQLQHHEALSDAKACARILIAASKVPVTASAKASTPQKKAEAPGQMRLDGSVDEIKIESTSPPEEPEVIEQPLPVAVQAEKPIENTIDDRSVQTMPGVRMVMPAWLALEAWPSGGMVFTCGRCNVLEHVHGYSNALLHGRLVAAFRNHIGCALKNASSVSDASSITTLPKSDACVVAPVAIENEQSASSEGTAEIAGTSDVSEASNESSVEPASNVSGVQLSGQQLAFFEALHVEKGNVALEARAGTGKCLGAGTPVMLFDGTIKAVEKVVIGDQLMGPDSKPRTVLATNAGIGPLYRIDPIKGESWVCNDVHILTLVGTNRVAGQVRDVPLNEFIREARPGRRIDRNWKLFRVPIDFPAADVPVDPYLFGLWLGDGSANVAEITNREPEIRDYCRSIASTYGAEYVERRDEKNNTWNLRFRIGHRGQNGRVTPHVLRRFFRSCAPNGHKVIPREYMNNSAEVRRALLAGLIDTDGWVGTGTCEIAFAHRELCTQVAFVARSLGLAATESTKLVHVASGRDVAYSLLHISGDLHSIPCKVPRRQCPPRRQIKNILRTGFEAHPIGTGPYFGFTLDGDGRFLLGDFTVTHNTFSLVEALNGGHTGVDNALFLAFNASIAAELKDRAPAWVDVSTFNALGKRLMAQKFGANVVEQRKEWRVLGEILTELDDASRSWWSRSRQFSIVGIVKKVFEGVDKITAALPAIIRPVVVEELPRDSYLGELERMESDRAALAGAYTEMAKEMLTRMWKDVTRLTFGEQIWSCFQRKLFKPSWPLILIDEAQDLNPLQMAVVQQLAGEGGRVVIVGDPRQAIYAWRGAHAKAFSTLVEGLNAKVLPLTVTRRCGRKIVELARKVVPDFSAPDDVHDGSIESVSLDEALELVRPGDMIVSRSNVSLVRTCLQMLKAGRHATIVGRDIAQSLSAIPEMAPKVSDLLALHKAIDAKYEFRIKLAEERGDRIDELDDERSCVLAIVQASGSIAEAVDRVQKLSASSSDDSRDPSVVRLMTTHKAKGLEADRVFVLAWTYRLSPERSGADTTPMFAKKGQPPVTPARALEEENLWYVAITRAKRELVLVRDPRGEAPNSLANRSAR